METSRVFKIYFKDNSFVKTFRVLNNNRDYYNRRELEWD